MHIGKRNLEFSYRMNDSWVKSMNEERELEILISKNLKLLKNKQKTVNLYKQDPTQHMSNY